MSNVWSDEFIKELKKRETSNWLKSIGFITISLITGYKAINSAFKTGSYRGSLIIAEADNENLEVKEKEN